MEKAQVERIVSSQTLAEADRVYRVRHRSDVDPTWRVKDGSEFWYLFATPEGDDGRNVSTLLLCKRNDPSDQE
jgi:head-tail adaptor